MAEKTRIIDLYEKFCHKKAPRQTNGPDQAKSFDAVGHRLDNDTVPFFSS